VSDRKTASEGFISGYFSIKQILSSGPLKERREMTRQLLGARIKDLRKSRKLSQNKVSEMVGIDPKHLSRIEVGSGYPSMDTLDKLAVVLNVDMKDFFDFVPERSRKELLQDLRLLLLEAEPEKLKLIYRVVRNIVR